MSKSIVLQPILARHASDPLILPSAVGRMSGSDAAGHSTPRSKPRLHDLPESRQTCMFAGRTCSITASKARSDTDSARKTVTWETCWQILHTRIDRPCRCAVASLPRSFANKCAGFMLGYRVYAGLTPNMRKPRKPSIAGLAGFPVVAPSGIDPLT